MESEMVASMQAADRNGFIRKVENGIRPRRGWDRTKVALGWAAAGPEVGAAGFGPRLAAPAMHLSCVLTVGPRPVPISTCVR